MPSERFMNLSEGKRQKIIEASIAEFSRVTLEEASINKIIRAAGISRGSFYTYFEDKEDLLGFLMEDIYKSCVDRCEEALVEMKGDLFLATHKLFLRLMGSIQAKEHHIFYRNLMAWQKVEGGGPPRQEQIIKNEKLKAKIVECLYARLDKSKIPIKDAKEFTLILELHLMVVLKAISKVFYDLTNLEVVVRELEDTLTIIKLGIIGLRKQ